MAVSEAGLHATSAPADSRKLGKQIYYQKRDSFADINLRFLSSPDMEPRKPANETVIPFPMLFYPPFFLC